MNLRLAEYDDWEACAALPETVPSSHVWQLNVVRDQTQPLVETEIGMTLRCVRLPRPVTAQLDGIPFEEAWRTAVTIFVVEDDPTLAAYLILNPVAERQALLLSRVVVAPAFRQRGVASALVRQALRWAAHHEYEALTASCPARNHAAVAFLMRNGFSFVGYNEALYARGGIALLWQRGV